MLHEIGKKFKICSHDEKNVKRLRKRLLSEVIVYLDAFEKIEYTRYQKRRGLKLKLVFPIEQIVYDVRCYQEKSKIKDIRDNDW